MKLLVMAKEPVAGRVKTRLCPPCTPDEAARLAEAALSDTLDAAVASGADEVVVALDGSVGDWCPSGVTLIDQVEGTLDVRLAAAWDVTGGPAVQIGMDTPQVTPVLLDAAMDALSSVEVDAVFGAALDGGWWLIGLDRADRRVFDGIPMSRPDTGSRQRVRLDELGLRVAGQPMLRDVDTIDDLRVVAAIASRTRFAAEVNRMALDRAADRAVYRDTAGSMRVAS